ncbi:hypothetical protein V8C42DRAFT_327089 [Trichoderma barbatum]
MLQLLGWLIYHIRGLGAWGFCNAKGFFGMAFPLFAGQMYRNIGIHWATTIPAFLTLACLPFPFVMLKFGERLRSKCKYAQEAADLTAWMQLQATAETSGSE